MGEDNRRRASRRLLALAIAAAAVPAAAFQPLVTDDTGTQGERGNQLEFSVDGDRVRAGGETTRVLTLPFTYTRGLTDTLDLFAGVSRVSIRPEPPAEDVSGMGNPVLGAKWRFFEDEEGKTSVALKPEVILPVSRSLEAEGLGSGRVSGALTLIVTREVGFGAVHANLSFARTRFRESDVPDVSTVGASIAPVWDVAPHWKLALDVGYEAAKAGGVTLRSRFAEVGAIYSPSEDLDFALGVIGSRSSAEVHETTTSATLGVTWRFK